MAFDAIEPFGQRRTDDGFRLIAALLFNANKDTTTTAMMPGDFLKVWEDPGVAEAAKLAALLAFMSTAV
jgi:hypothetical protein